MNGSEVVNMNSGFCTLWGIRNCRVEALSGGFRWFCVVKMPNLSREVALFLFPWVGDSWGILTTHVAGDSQFAGLLPPHLGRLYVIHKANKWADIRMF